MEKVAEYLDWIDEHFLGPVRSESVSSSCMATCLLVFATADAIGQLFCDSGSVGNRKRFDWTLSQLGDAYVERRSELWKLRNSLVHEALSASTLLSQVQDWSHNHLNVTADGKLLINTRILTRHMSDLLENLRCEVRSGSARAMRADSRLKRPQVPCGELTDTTPEPNIELL